jgi:hypothetical protein
MTRAWAPKHNTRVNNSGGDTIKLINPQGQTVDAKSYGNAPSGKVFQFE